MTASFKLTRYWNLIQTNFNSDKATNKRKLSTHRANPQVSSIPSGPQANQKVSNTISLINIQHTWGDRDLITNDTQFVIISLTCDCEEGCYLSPPPQQNGGGDETLFKMKIKPI